MIQFIPVIRNDRFRQIEDFEKKEIKVMNKRRYMLTDSIRVENANKQYTYEVRADFTDVRFYINNKSSCIYLTIYQIYRILNRMHCESDIDVIQALNRILAKENDSSFEYRSIKYSFPEVNPIEEKYFVRIPDSSLELTYTEIFVLISLIHTKSNYFWSLSDGKDMFKDGLIRLLATMLQKSGNHSIFESFGWQYNEDIQMFNPNILEYIDEDTPEADTHNEVVKRKYYLTHQEMEDILKLES